MEHPRIVQTPDVNFGKPRIVGRRLPVACLLEALATEGDIRAVAQSYACDVEDVKAALLYAADVLWGPSDLDALFDGADPAVAAE